MKDVEGDRIQSEQAQQSDPNGHGQGAEVGPTRFFLRPPDMGDPTIPIEREPIRLEWSDHPCLVGAGRNALGLLPPLDRGHSGRSAALVRTESYPLPRLSFVALHPVRANFLC